MAPKRILCLTNDRRSAGALLERSFNIARPFSAHITALHVRPDPTALMAQVDGQYFATMADSIFAKIEEEAEGSAKAVHEALERWRLGHGVEAANEAKAGVVTLSFSDVVGRLEAVVAHHAQISDLVIVGRPDADQAPLDEIAFEAALFAAGRPVLLTPLDAPVALSGTALLAWNASLESTHAMTAALPYLAFMKSVEVMTVGALSEEDVGPDEVIAYLKAHDISASAHQLSPGTAPPGRAILDRAAAIGASFIVMGAYGHSRMRQLLMGGPTRDALKSAAVPVLLAH